MVTNKKVVSVFVLILVIGLAIDAMAQQYIQHQSPTLLEREEAGTLIFSAPGLRTDQISDIYLMYRDEGNLAFNRQAATLERDRIVATLATGSTSANTLEYYLRIELSDGSVITFPERNPESNPVSINIVENSEALQRQSSSELQYNIMSPLPGSSQKPEDILMAVALFYGNETAEPDSFKVYFDDRDVSSEANISPFFISYIPDKLIHGTYNLRVAYFIDDQELTLTSWDFDVSDTPEPVEQENRTKLLPSGRVEFNARNQEYNGLGNDIYRGNMRLRGSVGKIKYSLNGLLTSQESSRLQPQNRFAAEVNVSNWLKFQAGHVYPQLNPLLISGRRMYGINSTISTPGNKLSLNVLHGNLNRKVDLQYTSVSKRTINPAGEPEVEYVMGLEPGGSGVYERKLTGARLGFGSGRNLQIGINALKVEDNVNSLSVINAFEDLPEKRLKSELTQDEYDELNINPEMFTFNGSNPRPQGNFMAGTDLDLKLASNKIQLKADFAASLHNANISSGVLNQTAAEDMGFDLDSNIENILNHLSRLIIINEQMSTLLVRFQDGDVEPFVPMGIFAGQTRLGLNFFKNNFTLQYRWVGPDYLSLANSSIRRDIAGYTITDRFRIFKNTLYVTLGHERLEDNVIRNRDATTVRTSYRANVSWYPISSILPRLSAGVNYQTRDNSVDREINPALGENLSFSAVRNVLQLANGEQRLLPNPNSSRTIQYTGSINREFYIFDVIHDASLNISDMRTKDDVFAFGDYDSKVYSLAIISRYQIPLRTTFALSSNVSNSVSGLNTMQISGINLGGSFYLLNKLLNIYADFAFTRNTYNSVALIINENDPANGFYDHYYEEADEVDISKSNSFNIRSGLQYDITKAHSVVLSMNLTNVVDHIGLNEIPTDHVMQARYVYNF